MSVYIHVLHFLNSNEIDYIRMYNGEFYVHVDAIVVLDSQKVRIDQYYNPILHAKASITFICFKAVLIAMLMFVHIHVHQ